MPCPYNDLNMSVKNITTGKDAPDFHLPDQDGKIVHLKDVLAEHPVVLFFYPGDMTPGCTIQLCAVRDDWTKFKDACVEVFGINHGKAESHAAFISKHGFPFPLLVDAEKKISVAYGATKKLFKANVIFRTVVGIGRDGIIRFYKCGMPKNTDILKAMKTTLKL